LFPFAMFGIFLEFGSLLTCQQNKVDLKLIQLYNLFKNREMIEEYIFREEQKRWVI